MSIPNIHRNFNPHEPQGNGSANVYNSTQIPPITTTDEQNFYSAPNNPHNHNNKIVRQWNLKFNGSSRASAEDFLT